jgi:signal transduction histidine kinase
MFKGIVRKIFISTSLLLLVFFVVQLYFQNTYIDKLYSNTKINTINDNLSSFVAEFDEMDYPEWQTNYLTSHYAKKNSAPILVVTEDHEILNSNFFREFNIMTLDLGKGQHLRMVVDYMDNFADFSISSASYGERVLVHGFPIGDSEFFEPLAINLDHRTYTNNASLIKKQILIPEDHEYSGIIKHMQIVSREHEAFNYTSHVLYDELLKPLSLKMPLEKIYESNKDRIIDLDWSNTYYMIAVNQTLYDNETVYFFTLHQIDKVAFVFTALNPYYILMYVICFLILLIIAFAYSTWITKPLLNLNRVAKSIANLDFSNHSKKTYKDELGELSNSLNTMSNNLEATISDLKVSNEQLASEATTRAENEKRVRYLLTNLSHEFKTPLSIISGFISVLTDRVHEKEPDYYYQVIQDEIENLNHLISETLELSKLDSGYYHMVFDTFNIDDIITKVCIAFDKIIAEKNLTLIKNSMNATVYGDRSKIEQVLINFVSNAVKYTKSNKNIIISVEEHTDDEIIILVENESTIDIGELDHIWKRYYRVEKNEKKSYKGSGIGLEIAKNILELHDSTYGVKNFENRVQFYFTISKSTSLNAE